MSARVAIEMFVAPSDAAAELRDVADAMERVHVGRPARIRKMARALDRAPAAVDAWEWLAAQGFEGARIVLELRAAHGAAG